MIKMSEEIKQKANAWLTLAFRTFMTIGMAVILKSVPMFIYDVAIWKKDAEDRMLSSVEMRIDLERHMEIWSPVAQREAFDRLKAVEDSTILNRRADSAMSAQIKEIRFVLARIERNQRKLLTKDN